VLQAFACLHSSTHAQIAVKELESLLPSTERVEETTWQIPR